MCEVRTFSGGFVLCQDTENNTFALWEKNENAK